MEITAVGMLNVQHQLFSGEVVPHLKSIKNCTFLGALDCVNCYRRTSFSVNFKLLYPNYALVFLILWVFHIKHSHSKNCRNLQREAAQSHNKKITFFAFPISCFQYQVMKFNFCLVPFLL